MSRRSRSAKWLVWIAAASFPILAIGIGRSIAVPAAAATGQSAAELKAAFADYKSWQPTTKKPLFEPANAVCAPPDQAPIGPHGDRSIRVYVSDNAIDRFVSGTPTRGPFPAGTVIVKEKLAKKAGEQVELGVMIKQPRGSSLATADWQYLYVDSHGKLTTDQTELQRCAACHSTARYDSVFGSERQEENVHVQRDVATTDPKSAFANYQRWKKTTDQPFLLSLATRCEAGPGSAGPHGDRLIQVYVSDTAIDNFVDGVPKDRNFPAGTVIVKEKVAKVENGKTRKTEYPVELGVMFKGARGSSLATADWQYLYVDRNGKLIDDPSEVQHCAACHSTAKHDSVFGHEHVSPRLKSTAPLVVPDRSAP